MIFQNQPVLDGNEKKYVMDCLETNWIGASGKYITQLEQRWADYCGVKYGVACSSGTTALHLALIGIGIHSGDEVLVPCFTLIADSNMVILVGARPVFVDVEPRTWCIDPAKIEEKITPKTKAILCVHMYGHPCDMDAIGTIARKHRLSVIEDAAQAHGTEYRGKRAGGFGHAACFSFYASKTLTMGEGGLVMTNDEAMAAKLRCIRSQGFEGDGRTYNHRFFGFNYRLTNIQAAIGLAQVEKIDEKMAKKRRIAARYSELLASSKGMRLPIEESWAKSPFWNYTILLDKSFGTDRSTVAALLRDQGVETRMPFNALHRQPVYQAAVDVRYPDVGGRYPVSEDVSDRGLCLPSGLNLTEDQICEVVEKLENTRG